MLCAGNPRRRSSSPCSAIDPELWPLQRLLIERTEGNPLFLEESVRSLVETEVLVGQPGAYRLGKDPIAIQVPATVQAILAARIDRLPPGDKALLQTASVIGKDVPWTCFSRLRSGREDELRRGIARLQAAEFVSEARLFPDLEYTFKHALTHDVAYGSLFQDRRRALHARIVEGIERSTPIGWPSMSIASPIMPSAANFGTKRLTIYARPARSPPSRISAPSSTAPRVPPTLWIRGEHDRALTLALEEQAVGASFGNFVGARRRQPPTRAGLPFARGILQGDEVLGRNVALLEGDLRQEMFGLEGLPSVLSRAWLALCLAERGRFDEADAYTRKRSRSRKLKIMPTASSWPRGDGNASTSCTAST